MGITTLKDKTAFITGGASGIGLGIAKVLVARGAHAVLADLRADHIERALAEFAAAGQTEAVTGVELNVMDREAYARVAADMVERFGGVDILVNNAGVGPEGPILEATYADWDFGLGVNVNGVVNGLISMLPQMREHGRGGHVVNTASLAATVYMPGSFTIYAASKAAVLNMSENMRADLAEENIGMSVLCPAFTKSNIHETGQNRPEHLREGSAWAQSEQTLSERPIGENWMEPEEVGEMVADGILADQLYIVTHGDFRGPMQTRHEALMAATPETETLGLGLN